MKTQTCLKVLAFVLFFLLLPFQVAANPLLFEEMGIVAPKTSKFAPGFKLSNIRGGTTQLSDFKGKIVLVNFWATWCAACIEEMASMQNLYDNLKKHDVEVVAISIDRWNEDRIIEYADKNKLSFHILRDPDQKVRKQYYVMGLPTSYLIDGDGKIRGYVSGARTWDSVASQNALLSLKGDDSLAKLTTTPRGARRSIPVKLKHHQAFYHGFANISSRRSLATPRGASFPSPRKPFGFGFELSRRTSTEKLSMRINNTLPQN